MNLAIIIPVYGQDYLTYQVIDDLYKDIWSGHIFIIDNKGEYKRYKNEVIIRTNLNLGWLKGSNEGLRIAGELNIYDCYMLLNNDVRLYKNFIPLMLQELKYGIGVIGPDQSIIMGFVREKFRKGIDKKVEENTISIKAINQRGSVDGCCMLISKEVYDKVGRLDEDNFGFYGYGADADYCIRVRRNGFKIIELSGVIVHHYHGVTGTSMIGHRGKYRRIASREGNKNIFKKYGKKWRSIIHNPKFGEALSNEKS